MIVIHMIKTKKECFITTCDDIKDNGTYTYSNELSSLLFDGEFPKKTFCKGWYVINNYPKKIERATTVYKNGRYEIKNKNMVCNTLPSIIKKEDKDLYEFDINKLYTYEFDKVKKLTIAKDVVIEVIMELEQMGEPKKIEYTAYGKKHFCDFTGEYSITNADVHHQMLDKIIFPNIMLHEKPCKLTSKQMYDITRNYIRNNIDLTVAKISSDYDFCFDVIKIISYKKPKIDSSLSDTNKLTYINAKKFIPIFEMCPQEYNKYTIIKPMYANNEEELKNKVDTWLENVINIINEPLEICPHCGGKGYISDIKPININKR